MQENSADGEADKSSMLSQDTGSEKPSYFNPEELVSSEPSSEETKLGKEIDLNVLFPEEEKDLNNLFPEEEMRALLKKIDKNRQDIAMLEKRFQTELQIGEKENDEL